MNLHLDGSWLVPGIGGTGIRRFSTEMIMAMLDVLPDGTLPHVFGVGAPVTPALRHPRARYVTVPVGYRTLVWGSALAGRPDLARWLRPTADALHVHDAVRFGRTGGRMTTVVTVHDCAALREPGTYPARAVWLRARALERLRRADVRVHAVSDATRADVVELGRVPAERVVTVHEGVADRFFTRVPEAVRRATLARLGLARPFVLAVGALHPRKNIPFLVRTFVALLRRKPLDLDLVLVGPIEPRAVGRLCADAGCTDAERARIRAPGAVSDLDLRVCLQACVCLAFPSRYEGFGLPVLEAMASGAAVVAARRSSLPEVVGRAGVLLEPDDADAWQDAILRLLESPSARSALGAQARERARRFTWRAAATRLLGLLDVPLASDAEVAS
jgi:glycosyltransferase involved in cell wall biosynthesis